ncbi:MAG: serine/threonine-protein kinase, partial [Polyangia bacterium]|nr:serine/threonine-protein kinase [Polyangia bacterium]
MKICPGCHRRYEDAVRFCPHDGIVLPDVSDEYVGRRLMEQFDILARCGEGAMGTVYRARQINMDRLVAIKILRRDLVKNRTVVKRFYREAKAAARLSHPNIITVHLVAETDEGLPYIVMEFLEGTDLDSLCKAEGALPIQRAVHLGAQIAAALSEAHRNDVVHRDLKPANIIVLSRSRPSEVVKVLDFGIAKIL